MTSPLQLKIKITGPVVITANRLSDGAVVYLNGNRRWVTQLDAATIVRTAEHATALLKIANENDVLAVGAYIAPVIEADGNFAPGNLREQIRKSGPTFELPASPGY
jgi:hypothetical protein